VQKNRTGYQGFQPLSAREVQLVQKLEVLSVGFCSDITQTPGRDDRPKGRWVRTVPNGEKPGELDIPGLGQKPKN